MKNKIFTLCICLFLFPCLPKLQTPTSGAKDTLTLEETIEKYEEEERLEDLLDVEEEIKEVEESPVEEKIFKVVEDIPTLYPECKIKGATLKELRTCNEEKMLAFIYKELNYPAIARKNKIEGRVIIQFVLEKDMTIQNVKILKDIGGGCGEEAARVVRRMSQSSRMKWVPGKSRGKPVKVQFTLPIDFKL